MGGLATCRYPYLTTLHTLRSKRHRAAAAGSEYSRPIKVYFNPLPIRNINCRTGSILGVYRESGWHCMRRATASCLLLQVAVCLTILVLELAAQESGSSNPAYRQEAIHAIPFQALPADVGRQIYRVVHSPSVYRRMPVREVRCDPDMHTFLVRNPDLVVGIWQRMGITQLQLTRQGPYRFTSVDGMGTAGQFQLVYGTPQLHLFYGTGFYEGPLLKQRIQGQCVALLRCAVTPAETEEPRILNALDVFVSMDHGAADLAAKTLQPMFAKTADENFVVTADFVGQMSATANRNPEGLSRLVAQLETVDEPVRAGMIQLVDRVRQRQHAITTPQVDGHSEWRALPR